jgi:hypothetical protein
VAGKVSRELAKSDEILRSTLSGHAHNTFVLPDGICLTSDGWSNILGEPIINYCAVTSSNTFFLEALSTETQGHSAEFIANDIKRVIDENSAIKEKIHGCCTDNTAANKSAWSKLQDIYPDKYFYGCVCHVLHLLVHDVVRELPWMNSLQETCQEFVRIIKKSGLLHANIKNMLKLANLNEFVLVGETRWGSVLKCFQRMRENINVVRDFANLPIFEIPSPKDKKDARIKLKATLRSTDFYDDLTKADRILRPLCQLIVAFQGQTFNCHYMS